MVTYPSVTELKQLSWHRQEAAALEVSSKCRSVLCQASQPGKVLLLGGSRAQRVLLGQTLCHHLHQAGTTSTGPPAPLHYLCGAQNPTGAPETPQGSSFKDRVTVGL